MTDTACRIGRSYPSAAYHAPEMQALTVSRDASRMIGTMSNWSPRRLSWREESNQREKVVLRATDIAVNDAHGSSIIDSISLNSVGTGLWPRSTPNAKRLGISDEQAAEVAESMEWEFEQFAKDADARGVSDFYGLQYQNVWSLLVKGEFVNLPLMLDDPARRYSLAIQTVDPARLRTPAALSSDPNVRDGIRLGNIGQPTGYFLADPENGLIFPGDLSNYEFKELAPSRGHRPVVMHKFVPKEPEQVRGNPIFTPVMKLIRDKNDYLDFELVAAIVAANFPVWIEKANPYDANTLPGVNRGIQNQGETTHYQELRPGQVHYGNPGEKPVFPSSQRPSGNLPAFLETVLRAIGAGGGGMPYEITAKDFSKTNYSSARAALEEAWRVFGFTQDWLIKSFCQPVFEMVFEEAWLRGRVKLPSGAPDFYAARAEWCATSWTVPSRTSLDPVKEMVAHVMGKQNNVATDADFCAGRGKDYEDIYRQRQRERKLAKDLDLPEVFNSTPRKKAETPDDPLAPDQENDAAAVADIIAEAVRQEVKAALRTEVA
ncbi:MAG: phage portal protein [Geobacteraceae bacterium GWC2_58_44]|nr:MAG: phage portal protein [Geobacteraceae bacterium GWC2_58_44]HBG07675.1 phage portal protein [Geobacter sp.]